MTTKHEDDKVSLGELLLNAGLKIVDLEKQSHDHVEIITYLEAELKSAQELNRELVEVVSQLVPIAEQRLRKIVNYDMPDYYKIRSEIQSIIEHGLSLINKSK